MPNVKAKLAKANEVVPRLHDLLSRAAINDSGEARVSATLCLTVVEQFAAVLLLMERGLASHAPIIIRSMLEGLADLRNVVKDPGHLDVIRLTDAKSNVRMFEEYAQVDGMSQDAIDTLNRWKAKAQPIVDELTAKGIKLATQLDKFKNVGMQENYVSYRVLCSFTHNQLTTLIARHAGDKFELASHREPPDQTTDSMLTLALAIACQAVDTLPSYSSLAAPVVREALDVIDKEWAAIVQAPAADQ